VDKSKKNNSRRLYMIAKEFNVSIDDIVDFLQDKKIDIKLHPLITLTDKQYDLIKKHFISQSHKNQKIINNIPLNKNKNERDKELECYLDEKFIGFNKIHVVYDKINVNEGKIVFWNGTYGFVEKTRNNVSYFFHKSAINNKRYNPQIFDKISFSIQKVKFGKHRGKDVATNIDLIKKGNYKTPERIVGILKKFKFHKGLIYSSQLPKDTIFYSTRIIPIGTRLIEGDLLIFHPVKSIINSNDFFAWFAYKIENEKDIKFLLKLYNQSAIPEVKSYIIKRIESLENKTAEEQLIFELQNLQPIDTIEKYKTVEKLILEFKSNNGFEPSFEILKGFINDSYLILLWENRITSFYDLGTIKKYFNNALANIKRNIIQKIKDEDAIEVLRYHITILKKNGKLDILCNEMKTLLDIVNRNLDTANEVIYKEIYDHITKTLKPNELIDLWLNDYISHLDQVFILKHFNIYDVHLLEKLFSKSDQVYKDSFQKIFEKYFFEFNKESDPNEEKVYFLVSALLIFQELFCDRFKKILDYIRINYNNDIKYILWIFGVNIDFNAQKYLEDNYYKINEYFILRFFIHSKTQPTNPDILSLKSKIDLKTDNLKEFVSTFTWNNLVTPTQILTKNKSIRFYFLSDVSEYNRKYNQSIDIQAIAESIYSNMPKYNANHLRLWLFGYLDDDFLDYFGFRQGFKDLTNIEKRLFKKKCEIEFFDEIKDKWVQSIIPCTTIIESNSLFTLYEAYIENIYFGNGFFVLRKHDRMFTRIRKEVNSSIGLNTISSYSKFNKIPIYIKVLWRNNNIIDVAGFNDIINLIKTERIETTLRGEPYSLNSPSDDPKQSYAEDMKLRLKIIEYLKENQEPSINIQVINEPKNFRRRLNDKSPPDFYEKTQLFTLDTFDGYAIVWENIDFSNDRATYVFLTKKENHSTQIEKISNAICTMAQLRSTLISRVDDKLLDVFKRNLGYVASIRRRRGDELSFNKWENRLSKIMELKIPSLPSKEELEELKEWQPEIKHQGGGRYWNQKRYWHKDTNPFKSKKSGSNRLIIREKPNDALEDSKSPVKVDISNMKEVKLKEIEKDKEYRRKAIIRKKIILMELKKFLENFNI